MILIRSLKPGFRDAVRASSSVRTAAGMTTTIRSIPVTTQFPFLSFAGFATSQRVSAAHQSTKPNCAPLWAPTDVSSWFFFFSLSFRRWLTLLPSMFIPLSDVRMVPPEHRNCVLSRAVRSLCGEASWHGRAATPLLHTVKEAAEILNILQQFRFATHSSVQAIKHWRDHKRLPLPCRFHSEASDHFPSFHHLNPGMMQNDFCEGFSSLFSNLTFG